MLLLHLITLLKKEKTDYNTELSRLRNYQRSHVEKIESHADIVDGDEVE